MSAAASGAPQPPNDPPGGGGPSKEPTDKAETPAWPVQSDVNGHNNWRKNSRVKTAKCDLCNERIKNYSWDCNKCLKRICSECAEQETGISNAICKLLAKNHLENKCGCAYKFKGGMAPGIQAQIDKLGVDTRPPKRLELDEKNKQEKVDIKKRKLEAAEAAKSGKKQKQKPKYGKENMFEEAADDQFEEFSSPRKPKGSTTRESKPPRAATSNKPCGHLHEKTTIIVGGGIVGLCIARELAMKTRSSGTTHKIWLIEAREGTCQLASGNCAGLISVHNWQSPCDSLTALALECWSELVVTESNAMARSDFVKECVYRVARFNGEEGREHKPSWYPGHVNDVFAEDESSLGKLDTPQFATWLHAECVRLKVQITYNTTVTRATEAGGRFSVSLQSVNEQAPSVAIPAFCENLVLAAGPYTPEIFRGLFSESPVQLDNNIKRAYWVKAKMDGMTGKDNVGLLFPDIAEADEELDDEMVMTGRVQRKDVVVYGTDAESQQAGLDRAAALQADEEGITQPAFRHLQKLAAKRLGRDSKEMEAASDVEKGSSWVSTADDGRPIIDKVPASSLRKSGNTEADQQPCGVWLCYGFGMHGTTLAPGVARALVRRMFGEPTHVDDSYAALPA